MSDFTLQIAIVKDTGKVCKLLIERPKLRANVCAEYVTRQIEQSGFTLIEEFEPCKVSQLKDAQFLVRVVDNTCASEVINRNEISGCEYVCFVK